MESPLGLSLASECSGTNRALFLGTQIVFSGIGPKCVEVGRNRSMPGKRRPEVGPRRSNSIGFGPGCGPTLTRSGAKLERYRRNSAKFCAESAKTEPMSSYCGRSSAEIERPEVGGGAHHNGAHWTNIMVQHPGAFLNHHGEPLVWTLVAVRHQGSSRSPLVMVRHHAPPSWIIIVGHHHGQSP